MEAVFGAMGQAIPERLSAAPAGTSGNFGLGGYDPEENRHYIMYLFSGGGYGGWFTFSGKDRGELAFLTVGADLDVRYGSRDGADCPEFSWEGFDDGTAASGCGWAALGGAPAVWSVTSSSIKVMAQALSPSASDFFNNLLSGSLSPTAAGAQQIENGVHRRPHFGLARPPTGPRRRNHWLQPRPLRVPKVARIILALAPLYPALLLRPHRCSPSP